MKKKKETAGEQLAPRHASAWQIFCRNKLAVVGLCFGLPVVAEYLGTGYVAKLPSAVLAVALMIVAALSWTAGLILDTVAKSHRRQWEMSVYRVMEADAER